MEDLSEPEMGVVEREELMVSLSGDCEPTMRLAHFLQPTVTSIDGLVFKVPADCLSSIPPTFEPKSWPLKLTFFGCMSTGQDWNFWVRKMASLNESTWKKAGIYEAIMNSTYSIRQNQELVLGLAEKWCPETNSFIFSWGEATITLEDMMIFGYSVLGSSVISPLDTEEQKTTAEKLNLIVKECHKTSSNKAHHSLWKSICKDSGSEIEHEAFLAYWLSRFVFPLSPVIKRNIFPIAIKLARGTRIALAPAVLAGIYRDLSLLKDSIVAIGNCEVESSPLAVTIRSPFRLVQIWAWERFLELRPNPNSIEIGESRFAQWHKTSIKVENVRRLLDSAKESFDWRPYTKTLRNWNYPRFYPEKEIRSSVDPHLYEDLESFARCLTVSKLPGHGCIEHYFPHRVAMQFGLDQDLPACVAEANYFSKPISYANVYVPSRLFEADVTTRYLEWWKQSLLHLQGVMLQEMTFRSFNRKKRTKRAKRAKHLNEGVDLLSCDIQPKESLESTTKRKEVSDASSSAGLPIKTLPLSLIIKKEINDSSFPPGFPPKANLVETRDTTEEDNLTITELLISGKKHGDDDGNKQLGDGKYLSGHCPRFSSSVIDSEVEKIVAPLTELIEKMKKKKPVKSGVKNGMEDATGSKIASPSHDMERSQCILKIGLVG